jgi:hypothetical protein
MLKDFRVSQFFLLSLGENNHFDAYHMDGVNWSGFESPLFSLPMCEILMKEIMGKLPDLYTFKRVDDGYNFYDHEEKETYFLEDRLIIVDGNEVVVNSLADGWCWEMV